MSPLLLPLLPCAHAPRYPTPPLHFADSTHAATPFSALQETFARMIETAGFRGVDYENLTVGVVAIHSGFKVI